MERLKATKDFQGSNIRIEDGPRNGAVKSGQTFSVISTEKPSDDEAGIQAARDAAKLQADALVKGGFAVRVTEAGESEAPRTSVRASRTRGASADAVGNAGDAAGAAGESATSDTGTATRKASTRGSARSGKASG